MTQTTILVWPKVLYGGDAFLTKKKTRKAQFEAETFDRLEKW